MEVIIDLLRQRPADPRHPRQVFHAGTANLLQPAELLIQLLTALCADARDLLQRGFTPSFFTPAAMTCNSKAMRFIAHLQDEDDLE